jgi:hypothetical protein
MPKTKKKKYYGVYSKDNFLYGVFPHSKEGYNSAKKYANNLSPKNKKMYFVKEK